jgi:hypothetical protein
LRYSVLKGGDTQNLQDVPFKRRHSSKFGVLAGGIPEVNRLADAQCSEPNRYQAGRRA